VVRDDLRYTAEHEWVEVTPDGTLRFGITDFAQEQLGDVVFVSLPDPGRHLDAGAACGEVESTKSVSDIYCPVAGEVVARNEAVVANPELVNSDPYGAGWMVEVRVADANVVNGLLDAAAYAALTA
jgi:glycine cleavage system H protein